MTENEFGRPLYAFFDLAVSPIGYDFISFLIMAEIARRDSGSDSLRVVTVPALGNGFRDDPKQDRNFGLEQRRWRITNIVLPGCALMPSCSGTQICADRAEGEQLFADVIRRGLSVYPAGYTVAEPTLGWETKRPVFAAVMGQEMPSLRAPAQAVDYVSSWMAAYAPDRKVVSMTLREAGWHDDRNSNVSEWVALAQWLEREGYVPVFVHDTAKVFDNVTNGLERFRSFDAASVNMEIRLAFYEASYLNLFVSNGPAELAMFDGAVRYILFKACAPSAYKLHPDPHGPTGLRTGSPLPFGTPLQVWNWEPDDFPVMKREFQIMADAIESSNGKAFERLSLKRDVSTDWLLDTAHLYRVHHQPDEARAIYRLFRESHGNSVEYWLWLAEVALNENDGTTAKSLIAQALSCGVGTAENYRSAGDVAFRLIEPAMAEKYYLRSLEIEGSSFENAVRMGLCYMMLERYGEAMTWLENALEFAPGHPFVLEKVAQVAKLTGKLSLAVDHWMKTRTISDS